MPEVKEAKEIKVKNTSKTIVHFNAAKEGEKPRLITFPSLKVDIGLGEGVQSVSKEDWAKMSKDPRIIRRKKSGHLIEL